MTSYLEKAIPGDISKRGEDGDVGKRARSCETERTAHASSFVAAIVI